MWIIISIIITMIAIITAVSNFVAYQNQKKRNEQIAMEKADIEEELQKEKKECNKCREVLKECIPYRNFKQDMKSKKPIFKKDVSLVENLDRLHAFWVDFFANEQFFKNDNPNSDQFFVDLYRKLKAADEIKLLQDRVTTPYYERLAKGHITAVESRKLTIKMAMELYDVISSFQSFNQRKQEQGLNIGIVKGTINTDEALSRAKIITDLEIETPLWVRNMALGLKDIGLEDENLILSGYKFPNKNN